MVDNLRDRQERRQVQTFTATLKADLLRDRQKVTDALLQEIRSRPNLRQHLRLTLRTEEVQILV